MKKLITFLSLGFFTFGYSQSDYYNDYQNSINSINWTDVVTSLLLSPSQQNQLMALNNQYPDYNSWNRVYGNNPDRWRTDRYNSMAQIMGNEKYVKFKNKYYKGQNPVAVYNRNKNNYKKYQNQKYKNIKKAQANGVNSKYLHGKARLYWYYPKSSPPPNTLLNNRALKFGKQLHLSVHIPPYRILCPNLPES